MSSKRTVDKIENVIELKNNEVIHVTNKSMTIKNDRLEVDINHKHFKHFDLAYCINTHVSQGSTYDLLYSIYEYQYFDQQF
jgi:ATP-dependent exoDNAse (exonuclease V) alpha subunit